MNKPVKILELHRNEIILNEDDENLTIELNEGASIENILKFEKNNSIEIPKDLKELLIFSNGVNFFGLNILSIEEMEYFPDLNVITFHNWGNGDFDCLSLVDNTNVGTVMFMSHKDYYIYGVCSSLHVWFQSVLGEIKKNGTLLHPLDYLNRKSEGLYKNILNEIGKP